MPNFIGFIDGVFRLALGCCIRKLSQTGVAATSRLSRCRRGYAASVQKPRRLSWIDPGGAVIIRRMRDVSVAEGDAADDALLGRYVEMAAQECRMACERGLRDGRDPMCLRGQH